MILHVLLGALAVISFLTTLWQWLAARRFPLHRRLSARADTPAVTLLKPLKGCDEHTEACLRSWFAQDYVGAVQILFTVANADDPALCFNLALALVQQNKQTEARPFVGRALMTRDPELKEQATRLKKQVG